MNAWLLTNKRFRRYLNQRNRGTESITARWSDTVMSRVSAKLPVFSWAASALSMFSREKSEYHHLMFVKRISALLVVKNTPFVRQYKSDCKYFYAAVSFFSSLTVLSNWRISAGSNVAAQSNFKGWTRERDRQTETNQIKATPIMFWVEAGRQGFSVG